MSNFFQSPFFTNVQVEKTSYEVHDSQYSQIDIEKEKQRHIKNTIEKTQYTGDEPLGLAIDKSKELEIAVDIGCGTGWATNLLSETKQVVYAIEPSLAAIAVAKKLYPDNDKIVWLPGFAQKELSKLSLDKPALFNSLCVMSHLKDVTVIEICQVINKIALPGSVLSFSECYGCDYDDGNLWLIREKDWWRSQFPGWKFDFLGRNVNHPPGAKKNFIAIRQNVSSVP